MVQVCSQAQGKQHFAVFDCLPPHPNSLPDLLSSNVNHTSFCSRSPNNDLNPEMCLFSIVYICICTGLPIHQIDYPLFRGRKMGTIRNEQTTLILEVELYAHS